MRPGQRRALVLRGTRSGLALALPAQCAALFIATAFAVAAPGPALSSQEPVPAGAPGEPASTPEASAQHGAPAAPAIAADAPAGEAIDGPSPDEGSAGTAPQEASEAVQGDAAGPDPQAGERADRASDVEARPPVAEATADAAAASQPIGAGAPAPAADAPASAFAAQDPSAAAPPAVPDPVAAAPPAAPDPGTAGPPAVPVPPPPTVCPAHAILGTDGDDALTGTPGPDFICGLGGNDIIDGGLGDDTIDGGDGDDTLAGGEGADCLAGGAGDDRLDGGPGDDTLDGGSGENVLVGGDGFDAGSEPLADAQPGESENAVFDPVSGVCKRPARPARPRKRLDDVVASGGAAEPEPRKTGILGAVVGQVKQGFAKIQDLAGADDAQAAVPAPLAVFPLDRPLALQDGYALLRVTCFGSFTTSMGELTLTTLPEREGASTRVLADSTSFRCSEAQSKPVVKVRLPIAERRLISRVGRLRVRATAIVEDTAGRRTVARSFFTLVPQRP